MDTNEDAPVQSGARSFVKIAIDESVQRSPQMAAFHSFSENADGPDPEKLSSFFSPAMISQMIGQAIQHCWMMLPHEKKTPDELESTIRQIFDRAIQNFRDDCETFKRP